MDMTQVKLLKSSSFWLLGVASGLVAIYMTLLARTGDTAHLVMSMVYWLVVGSLLWSKRDRLKLKSEVIPGFLGVLLIGLVLWQSSQLTDGHFLRLIPFISAVGLALLASGFQGFKQYAQEMIILFFLGVPSVLASFIADISPVTAGFSAFLLFYFGFDAQLHGVNIILPTGSVKVYAGCSGIEAMTYLLGISVIFLVMFPTKRSHIFSVPIVAIILGFLVNSFRVALMAILVAYNKPEAFHYWHEGDGSLVFGMISILIFSFFYWLLIRNSEPDYQDSQPGEISQGNR